MKRSPLTTGCLCLLAILSLSAAAHAQSSDAPDCGKLPTHKEQVDCADAHTETRIIYLKNVTNSTEANDLATGVRNMFSPSLRIYLITSLNAISVSTYPAEIERVEAYLHQLDQPHKAYRLTYTIAVVEDSKTVGVQHFSLVALEGQRTTLKEGDKIPVATGSFSTDNNASQTQFTYLDVGMNFDATPTSVAGGVSLKTKVEQSSIGATNTIAGVAEPVVRQSVLESVSIVTLGKPLMLGSIDIPNTTRHLDVDVMVEPLK